MSAPSPSPALRTLCYTTLLTSDSFLPGVQVLLKTLFANVPCCTSVPLPGAFFEKVSVLVLVTPNVSKSSRISLLRQCSAANNFFVKVVDPVPAPPTSPSAPTPPADASDAPSSSPAPSSSANNWDQTYTKLSVFNPSSYSDVLVSAPSTSLLCFYIDADCLVLQDPTFFAQEAALRSFSLLPSPEGLLGASPDVFPPDNFNAGVMLVAPSSAVYADLLSKLDPASPGGGGTSYDGGDTGYLNWYYPDWFQDDKRFLRLPFRCNAQRILHWFTHAKRPGYWDQMTCARRELPATPGATPELEGWHKPPPPGVVILHYSSTPKPWADKAKKGDLEMLWWEWFTKM